MSENEKQRRRAAAARELETRAREESDYAEWTARADRLAAADPLSAVRDAAVLALADPLSTPDALAELRRKFPAMASESLAEACRQARALHTAAGEVAEGFREHRLSRCQALAQLSASCPGFSANGYERAFGAGLAGTR